jgi:type I restriction enzyme S subunit
MEVVVEEGYKMTEVGRIPEDWEVKRIDEVLTFGSGQDYKHLSGGDYPVYGTGGLMTFVNDFLYEGDSVGIGRKGTIDKPVFLSGRFWTVDTLFYTRSFIECIPKFIYYKFLTIQWKEYNEASGVPSLNKNTLGKIKIAIPSITEQRAIATALSDVDALISGLDKLIEKKKAIKQGAMQELLTPPEQGGKRLEGFSGDWDWISLGQLANITMGQSPSSSNYNYEGIGLPLVQGNADIQDRRTIIRNYTSQITKTGRKGDIIMSVRAPVGEVAKASFDCCLGRGVCSISYDNEFLYQYLLLIEPNWSKFSTGSTFDSINSNQLASIQIPIPKDSKEQMAIAKVLSDIDSEVHELENKRDKCSLVKQGMMQELLTGKIRLL